MISLQLTEVKECMQKLLLSETFDNFLFIEGSLTTFGKFTFDGYIQQDYYLQNETDEINQCEDVYSKWQEFREYCYQLIKGKHTPLHFKFIFALSNANITRTLEQELPQFKREDVQGMYMNFQFENNMLHCTTGTSMNTFTLDKSLDVTWDKLVKNFLKQNGLIFEEL